MQQLQQYYDSLELTQLEKLNMYIRKHVSTIKFSNHVFFSVPHKPTVSRMVGDVLTGKGGICVSLNYIFSMFLFKHGIKNRLVRADKRHPKTGIDCRMFHVSIIATIDDEEYFVDVGYGRYFYSAILLKPGVTKDGISVVSCEHGFKMYKGDFEIIYVKLVELTNKEFSDNYRVLFDIKPDEMGLVKAPWETIYSHKHGDFIQLPIKDIIRHGDAPRLEINPRDDAPRAYVNSADKQNHPSVKSRL